MSDWEEDTGTPASSKDSTCFWDPTPDQSRNQESMMLRRPHNYCRGRGESDGQFSSGRGRGGGRGRGRGRGFGRGGGSSEGGGKCYNTRGRGRTNGVFPTQKIQPSGRGNYIVRNQCQESGHMSRDCPNPKSVGERPPMTCHKCQKEGHMARNCPDQETNGFGERKPMTCNKCHEEGHMARDCPSGGGSDRPRGCFKCKEEGHMSRDCPQGGGNACHKCGEEGHFARDCTTPAEDCPGKEGKPAPVTYVPVEMDESELFQQGVAAGENFAAFEEVSVKVSGSGRIPQKINTFAEGDLRGLLLENVQRARYVKPTPIQKHAIPIIKAGRDIMGCAQTGSGKTAAFLLPILNYILENSIEANSFEDPVRPTALIVAPTRELAIQIYNEAKKFSSGSVVKVCIVYGGTSVSHQHKGMQRGCHILVATPGRLLDYVERGRISFECVKFIILDEADRMLDMGFKSSIDKIMNHGSTPAKEERQTLMFSATFAKDIQELAKNFLNDYIFVVTGHVGAASLDVQQTILNISKNDKRENLLSFIKEQLQNNKNEKILVFVETKRSADFLALYLSSQEVNTTSIHGDRFQSQREEALREFKRGERNVLVATAVAARGLDIKGVGIVLNYDMPKEIDEYVHRIGRTGRVGNAGTAISYFDVSDDAHLAKDLLKLLGDAEQNVPTWLIECANMSGGVSSFNGRGNFGASDIRNRVKTEEFPAASAMGGPYQSVPSGVPEDESWD